MNGWDEENNGIRMNGRDEENNGFGLLTKTSHEDRMNGSMNCYAGVWISD